MTQSNDPLSDDVIFERFHRARLAVERRDWNDAFARFEKLARDNPDSPEAWNGKGVALYHLARREEAIECFLRSLELDRNYPDAWNHLGNCYRDAGRFREAIEAGERAVSLRQDYPGAWYSLALALITAGVRNRARKAILEAIHLRAEYPDAWAVLGLLNFQSGSLAQAERWYRKAISLSPREPFYLIGLADLFFAQGRYAEAAGIYRSCLRIDPEHAAVHSMLLMSMAYTPGITHADIYRESVRWGIYHALGKGLRWKGRKRNNRQKIRIGYLSADLFRHTVGNLLLPILRHADRQRFEVYCYQAQAREDSLTAELRAAADGWRIIYGLDDAAALELILRDELDILVDAGGHSGDNRLGVFALRPAPVLVSWPGYSHTTGLPTMDFFIADPVTVPEEDEVFFTEQVIRLPYFRLFYQTQVYSPEVTTAPALDTGCITFGSFNNIAKITPEVVALWSKVLNSVTGSRLILKWKTFKSALVRKRYLKLFREHGITSERIEFREETSYYFMLMEYGDIDIALDTFPYSGGITSCDALWMGVPVVTLNGGTPIGRQGAAILSDLGLPDLVASDENDYVRICRGLSLDLPRLQTLRSELRKRMADAPFCSPELFVRDLEKIYFKIKGPKNLKTGFTDSWLMAPVFPGELLEAAAAMYFAGKMQRADELCRLVLSHDPGNSRARMLTGMIASRQGEPEKAITILEELALRDPANVEVINNLAKVYKDNGLLTEAGRLYNRLIELQPDNLELYFELGGILIVGGRVSEGIEIFRGAIRRNADESRLWGGLMFLLNYSHQETAESIFRMHKQSGMILAKKTGKPYRRWPNQRDPERRLRIGYVSGDFGMHPVGYFMLNIIRNHNRPMFETFCYSNRALDDDLTCFFKERADHWRNLWKVPLREAVNMVRRDGIDILIDLSGHTKDDRLDVFARKPAPVQVTWLGYPNTTGFAAIDYRITDGIADPPGHADAIHTERLYRLPNGFLCFYPPPYSPEPGILPLDEQGIITFGSSNNLAKITPEVIRVWARILAMLPDARLLIKRSTFKDPGVREYFEEIFLLHGVTPGRLLLREGTIALQDHLAFYNEIDIALDTFPYNGTTTTCEALWMGIPVVVLAGDRHAARVGVSILSRLGLEELIAASPEDYITKSVQLALDPERLRLLRRELRPRMAGSALCNGAQFAIDLEDAFRNMWREWCQKQVP